MLLLLLRRRRRGFYERHCRLHRRGCLGWEPWCRRDRFLGAPLPQLGVRPIRHLADGTLQLAHQLLDLGDTVVRVIRALAHAVFGVQQLLDAVVGLVLEVRREAIEVAVLHAQSRADLLALLDNIAHLCVPAGLIGDECREDHARRLRTSRRGLDLSEDHLLDDRFTVIVLLQDVQAVAEGHDKRALVVQLLAVLALQHHSEDLALRARGGKAHRENGGDHVRNHDTEHTGNHSRELAQRREGCHVAVPDRGARHEREPQAVCVLLEVLLVRRTLRNVHREGDPEHDVPQRGEEEGAGVLQEDDLDHHGPADVDLGELGGLLAEDLEAHRVRHVVVREHAQDGVDAHEHPPHEVERDLVPVLARQWVRHMHDDLDKQQGQVVAPVGNMFNLPLVTISASVVCLEGIEFDKEQPGQCREDGDNNVQGLDIVQRVLVVGVRALFCECGDGHDETEERREGDQRRAPPDTDVARVVHNLVATA
eukprot:PhM_4_TR14095/c0_g1_i1/m.49866